MKRIQKICDRCGAVANIIDKFKANGTLPHRIKFTMSTMHEAECDFCGDFGPVTEARDFFYPDFTLLKEWINDTYAKIS